MGKCDVYTQEGDCKGIHSKPIINMLPSYNKTVGSLQ